VNVSVNVSLVCDLETGVPKIPQNSLLIFIAPVRLNDWEAFT